MNLFLELRRHGKLANKRNPMYEKSRFAEIWMLVMGLFWAGYLIFFGTLFGLAFQGESREAYQILNAGLIIVLGLDFLLRFPFQKTPGQEIKPYLLLPIKRHKLIDMLLIRSGLSGFNLLWLFMFVPFAILTVSKFYGVSGVLSYCIGIWLLILLNNYWFLLCRTLMNESIWWTGLPLVFYAAIIALLFIPDNSPLMIFFIYLGEGLIQGSIFTFAGVLIFIGLLWWINSKVIEKFIYQELNKIEDTTVKVKTVSEYKFLDKYGEIGEYMRLELKLMLRNKITKMSLRTIIILVLLFSCLLSFTDIYDGQGMKTFILVYNFVIFGILFLSQVMSYEGNYIDGLMSRKESIYNLLRAKYMVYSCAIAIPLLVLIPAMVMGKLNPLQCIAWALFTVGPIYFGLFHMAIYNNNTVDLNTKMTSRNNMGTGMQNLISFLALGIPILFATVIPLVLGDTATNWLLIVLGLVFIATSKFWLKSIYRKFMKRRYINMEGFRNSRQH